ncbi:MAG: phosphotransferase [Arcanobacterium sp.]|nr:phosphotransferase [Arcanobacterium sp.]
MNNISPAEEHKRKTPSSKQSQTSQIFTNSETTALTSLINDWIRHERWYSGDRKNPDCEILFTTPLDNRESVLTILLIIRSADVQQILPLTFVPQQKSEVSELNLSSEAAHLGTVQLGPDTYRVIDATALEAGQKALLKTAFGVNSFASTATQLLTNKLRGDFSTLPEISRISKISSEQSNTSIAYHFSTPDSSGATGLMLKVFRILQEGENPDIELQVVLDRSGSNTVPKHYASVSFTNQNITHADLLMVQEFISEATDAWQLFQQELERAPSYPQEATTIRELGTLTAAIHHTLAEQLPTFEYSPQAKLIAYEHWLTQLKQAIKVAPALQNYAEAIENIFASAVDINWPIAQRIHGDYHLGQVLRSNHGNWTALDFEGEPLKPISERTQPSLALRDIAGMLRSFDYAAGSAELSGHPVTSTRPWAEAAKQLFLEGYGPLSIPEQTLLKALIIDKALYEVIYEATYRPRWLQIPLNGIKLLISPN